MHGSETALRAEIVRLGRLMRENEYVDGASGNLSARLGADRILATPSGLAKGFLDPEQLLVLDMDGRPAGPQTPAARELRPTSEILMHLEAYRQRPDVGAVIHAHPITAVALSIAGVSLAECLIPEAIVVIGLVPTTPYSTPSSEENQRAIRDVIQSHDAIILQYHGALTVGKDLWDAYLKLETLEHTAKIAALARLLGGGPTLPPEQVAKLLETRKAWGYARPGDEEEFCLACGVCHPHGNHRATPEARERNLQSEAAQVRRIVDNVRRQLAR